MLKAFIDDSGSDSRSEWYVLAGYICTVQGWNSFDAQWDAALKAYPPIEYFHAAEAESRRPDGIWAQITPEQRDAKIDSLIQVIGRCTRRAICARIRRKDYNDLVMGQIPEKWDSPYYFLYTTIIGAAINIERVDGNSDSIDFVFDKDERHEKGVNTTLHSLVRMRSAWDSIIGIVRKDDRECLPLQAADLLAWQIRRFFSVKELRRKHFDAAKSAPSEEYHQFVMDRPMLAEAIEEIRSRAADLARSLGRSPDVRTWD